MNNDSLKKIAAGHNRLNDRIKVLELAVLGKAPTHNSNGLADAGALTSKKAEPSQVGAGTTGIAPTEELTNLAVNHDLETKLAELEEENAKMVRVISMLETETHKMRTRASTDAETIERLKLRHAKLSQITAVQCRSGNYDVDEYMRGMANGLILADATMNDIEPTYIDRVDHEPVVKDEMESMVDAINRELKKDQTDAEPEQEQECECVVCTVLVGFAKGLQGGKQ